MCYTETATEGRSQASPRTTTPSTTVPLCNLGYHIAIWYCMHGPSGRELYWKHSDMYRSDIFHGIHPFDECTLQGYGPAYLAIVALSASKRQSMTYLDGREARWVCLNAFGRLCPRSSIRIGMPWAPFKSSLVCLSSKAAQAWQPCHVILPCVPSQKLVTWPGQATASHSVCQ